MPYKKGQRLSFKGTLCTVRWTGVLDDNVDKTWFGVEWDDPLRGKHDGRYKGKQIFSCENSTSGIAASFLPASRNPDPSLSFVEALRQKYATEDLERRDVLSRALDREIEISGKVVHEVGFDKVRMQLKKLDQLKHVVLDGMRIVRAKDDTDENVRDICPRIQSLVMRRNLFYTQVEILNICRDLRSLQSLDISGNRFKLHSMPEEAKDQGNTNSQALVSIHDLSLDETMLTWDDLWIYTSFYASLRTLSASGNDYSYLEKQHDLTDLRQWTTLKLENNSFTSLHNLSGLSSLPELQSLHLKGNEINRKSDDTGPSFKICATFVDLSYNKIDSWKFVDNLPRVFPNMVSLRIDHNPFYTVDPNNAYLLTIARLANLSALNYRAISPADRTDAEMFYLSTIAKELSLVSIGHSHTVLDKHPRYHELCGIYGEPTSTTIQEALNPNFLEARLIEFVFQSAIRTHDDPDSKKTQTKLLPKSLNVYQLKGIVRKLFHLEQRDFRLVLEPEVISTQALPTAESNDKHMSNAENGSDSDDDGSTDLDVGYQAKEVELTESTRSIGNIIGAVKAKVKVEER